MTRPTHLVLGGLPTFESSSVFCCIDERVEAGLKHCPSTYARIQVATHFLHRFGSSGEFLYVKESELQTIWAGYLRGALMEFAGLQEAIAADVRRLGFDIEPPTVTDTGNAMLIMVRELRNIHVHVVQHRFEHSTRSAVLRVLNEEHPTVHPIITIPREDLDQLLQERVAKHFFRNELEAGVEWLDWAQTQWGIQDVVLASLDIYASALHASLPETAV